MSDAGKSSRRSRRTVLAGAGTVGVTVLLGGCQTYGGSASAPEPAGVGAPDQAGTPGQANAPDAAGALAAVADIPVGGGKIFSAEQVVVTQPTAGTIRAFSAQCTHQGCTVSAVRDRTIVCGCHNSTFDIADGSVTGGPANRPLPAAAVTVADGSIRLA